MKIYLTEECKQELEAKIAELEKSIKDPKDEIMKDYFQGQESLLKEILSSVIILPVEESWYKVVKNVENDSQSLIISTHNNL